jgi:porin
MLNLEQQLGKDNPMGVFVRTGWTSDGLAPVQNGSACFAAGFVCDGPSESPLLRTEQAYFAAGVYWLQVPGTGLVRQDEYGLEFTYVLQLTETLTLQPDLQFVFDAVNNPVADANTIFTIQLNYVW